MDSSFLALAYEVRKKSYTLQNINKNINLCFKAILEAIEACNNCYTYKTDWRTKYTGDEIDAQISLTRDKIIEGVKLYFPEIKAEAIVTVDDDDCQKWELKIKFSW